MSDRDSITLRPAQPTFEEGLVFARYLDVAAEGFIRTMLGRRAPQIVASAYREPANSYSYSNVTFAELDGRIVGMASAYTGTALRSFSEEPVKRAAGFPALRMRTMTLLFAPILRILKTVAEEDFYLLALAVDSEQRGKGIGSALMDSVEEQAFASGSARLSLDVSAKNHGAIRLYERRGMSVGSPYPRIPFVPPLFVRMSKPLPSTTRP